MRDFEYNPATDDYSYLDAVADGPTAATVRVPDTPDDVYYAFREYLELPAATTDAELVAYIADLGTEELPAEFDAYLEGLAEWAAEQEGF